MEKLILFFFFLHVLISTFTRILRANGKHCKKLLWTTYRNTDENGGSPLINDPQSAGTLAQKNIVLFKGKGER